VKPGESETLEEGAARRIPAEVAEGEERTEALRDGLLRVQQPLAEEPLHLRGRLERGGGRHLTPATPYGSHAPVGKVVTGGGGGGGEGNPGVGKKRRRRGRARVESTPTVRSERATSPLRTDGRQRPALTGSSRCRWVPTPLTQNLAHVAVTRYL